MFNNLSERLTNIVRNLTGRGRLTEENIKESLDNVKTALLEADVALSIVDTFLANIKTKAMGQKVVASLRPGDALVKIVYDELISTLGEHTPLNLQASPPVIIMVVGLQGSGKTTTIAKLAYWLKTTQKKSVLLASVDIYRPAAIEQLRVLADQIAVSFFTSSPTDTPLAIAKATIDYAKNKFIDNIIIDTAGRLHIDQEMMAEIKHLYHEIRPLETLLVVDSMMGQDTINIAKTFADTIPLTGVILTKTDGDARGGAAVVMRVITNQSIKFIGTGEKIDALEPFYPDRIASRILGMGDILTLVEEAYQKVDHEKAAKLAKKSQKGKAFDLEDFRTQLQQMRKLGGMSNLISKLPGLGKVSPTNIEANDKTLVKMEAIINSMTPRERHFPAFIKGSNKQRIAKGSGTLVQDINRLLKQFDQMQKMMQRLKGSKMQNMLKQLQGF
ncbi:MAG: signal recognition particle protein [Coxiellaceae bacterium]|jgi:signal recognition particle subunit SRP54|nr:signal recognition particle protein [Coxiellaceae bacterium]